jgi:hypothetical protein
MLIVCLQIDEKQDNNYINNNEEGWRKIGDDFE